jgi:hypothetical protein
MIGRWLLRQRLTRTVDNKVEKGLYEAIENQI